MRDLVINKSLLFIKQNSSYNDEKLAEIKYGPVASGTNIKAVIL